MANEDFLKVLTRLTAQSKDQDPKKVKGGVPVFQAEDIQLLASQAGISHKHRRAVYWTLMARWCQHEIAEDMLLAYMRHLSWRIWGASPMTAELTITAKLHGNLVGAAISVFLNPYTPKGKPKQDQWVADFIGIHRSTFLRKYKGYYRLLLDKLDQWERVAIFDILKAAGRAGR